MYGLRDAEASFDQNDFDVMNLMGVSVGEIQHLCWIQEGDDHVGPVGALE